MASPAMKRLLARRAARRGGRRGTSAKESGAAGKKPTPTQSSAPADVTPPVGSAPSDLTDADLERLTAPATTKG